MKYFILLFAASILWSCSNTGESEKTHYTLPPEIEQVPFGTAYGLRAPEIKLPDTEGKKLKLSDLRGKLVLVDFWASWCQPCRKENPLLVKAYNKYHDKAFSAGDGFEIFSVSIDRKESAWKEAIKKDKLSWPYQVSDLKGNTSQAMMDYNVQFIPTNYLLDKNGVIIASNLRGQLLEAKLEELLIK